MVNLLFIILSGPIGIGGTEYDMSKLPSDFWETTIMSFVGILLVYAWVLFIIKGIKYLKEKRRDKKR